MQSPIIDDKSQIHKDDNTKLEKERIEESKLKEQDKNQEKDSEIRFSSTKLEKPNSNYEPSHSRFSVRVVRFNLYSLVFKIV